ncbi:kinase-like domain-containing protein [Rhizophagus clarus]|uniref:Kinase-like domain-containing protein n=1 Tax=Rhizophagus clarus TaxID=94130 RepID=A0A8H3QQ61_9GLOM|nr:kinase-like domain-containing protein [Rhizophagus clarus]
MHDQDLSADIYFKDISISFSLAEEINFIIETLEGIDTIYNAIGYSYPLLLEWVPFDKFEDIKQIDDGGSWMKEEPEPIKVALKRLNGSQNMSADFLNEAYFVFGVVMTELSSGKPPFHNRKHDISLALRVCNGLRPEFGKGTPEIYKKLAHRCMNANPNQRPTANESDEMLNYWNYLRIMKNMVTKEKRLESYLKEADKELPNISTSYEKNSDAIYASRAFTFNKLSKPINSSFITLNEENIEGWCK